MKRLNKKTKRNERIAKLRISNPEKWTVARLGDKYGISRQRIQGICVQYVPNYKKFMEKWRESRRLALFEVSCIQCGGDFKTCSSKKLCSTKCLVLHNHARRLAIKTKRCTKCRKTKTIDNFRKTNRKKSHGITIFSYVSRCKPCQNKITSRNMRIWQRENPERAKAINRAYYKRKHGNK